MFKKGPTFLRIYVLPVLLFNLAFVGWSIVVARATLGWWSAFGYAMIVTVGLYVFLAYLNRYLY